MYTRNDNNIYNGIHTGNLMEMYFYWFNLLPSLLFPIPFSFLNLKSLNSLFLLASLRSHKAKSSTQCMRSRVRSLGLSPLCICHHLVSIRAASDPQALHNTHPTAGTDLHAQATFTWLSSRHTCTVQKHTRRPIGLTKRSVCTSHQRAREQVFV